jgi:hypothetical protein
MTVELESPPSQPQVSAASARLVAPRNEALKAIKTQLERGLEIKRAKIRYVADLERAREAKGEWTTTIMTMLKGMFSSSAVADECQNWVGKVLPEYADLNLFIEHFYDEMDQRLRKLHSVYQRIKDLADDSPKPVSAPAQVPATNPDFFDAPAGAPRPAATAPAMRAKTGAFIVYDADERAQTSVRDFCIKLGFEVTQIASGQSHNTVVEQLDQNPQLDFGLILSRADAPPKPFELGYCVGRLGLKRVFVLSPCDDKLAVDEHGLLHIPLDPADGWQLHLARQFKRAGLEIDLNRVF